MTRSASRLKRDSTYERPVACSNECNPTGWRSTAFAGTLVRRRFGMQRVMSTMMSVVLLAAAGCSGATGQSSRARADAPALAQPRFAASTMAGWSCSVRVRSRLFGPSTADAPMEQVSTVELAVIGDSVPSTLGMQVRSARSRLSMLGVVMSQSIDHERIEIVDPKQHTIQRVADGAEPRRVIEMVTASPSVFVELDAHARLLAHRTTLDEGLGDRIPSLPQVGLVWLFGYPELPEHMRVRESWSGTRTLPAPSASARTEVQLAYRVRRISRGEAEISMTSAREADLGMRLAIELAGRARVRVADGALLSSSVDVELGIGDSGQPAYSWRYETSCAPPR